MSHSVDESIHDRIYSIKLIVKNYEPHLFVWLAAGIVYDWTNHIWNENTENQHCHNNRKCLDCFMSAKKSMYGRHCVCRLYIGSCNG